MRPLALYWSLMLWVMPPLAAVEPVILNVQAEQITGTRWFDISYEIRDPDSAVVSVSLKISAIEGWEFLGWSSDYVSNDPKLSWEVKAPTHLVATFGTTVNTVATGGGKIALEPAMKVYLYGSKVRVIAVPDLGYGLSLWGGAGVDQTQSEWTLTVTNATPKISALFGPVLKPCP